MVYIEIKREAGSSGDAQQEGMAYLLKDHATEEFMASWQTLRPALLLTVSQRHVMQLHMSRELPFSVVLVMQSDLAMDNVSCTMPLLLSLQQSGFADCIITMNHLQVVGPSVRAFGMCVDANSMLVCEPLCPAIDMLLIPHLPQPFAMLASLFAAMPQLVSSALEACVATFPAVLAVSATQGLSRTCS